MTLLYYFSDKKCAFIEFCMSIFSLIKTKAELYTNKLHARIRIKKMIASHFTNPKKRQYNK